MENKQNKNELEILFPNEIVTINGLEVVMRPLPLKKLPMILKQFRGVLDTIMKVKAGGMGSAEVLDIAMELTGEAAHLLPLCLFKKDDAESLIPLGVPIPAKAAYDLMKLFIKQNVPEELVGKIKALITEEIGNPNQKAKD